MPAIAWFRRDLRRADHPALGAAAESDPGRTVIPVFVLDPAVWGPASAVRRTYLSRSLRELAASLDDALLVLHGDPVVELPALAARVDATEVHCSADLAPYGAARDGRVEAALAAAGRRLVRTGSPYAVAPGRVLKDDGTPYRVYSPFYKGWLRHGWRAPAPEVTARWLRPEPGVPIPADEDLGLLVLPPAGEEAALARWADFRADGVTAYADRRDRPDLAGTSSLSHHLRWGEIHPRTILADLGDTKGEEVFRKEIAWREFYGDVLWNAPASARASLNPRYDTTMPWSTGPEADAALATWATGCTGYPFVDAGMRQLRAEGWMHNRVRMVVASFLVKDLHLPWQRGAREFMQWLRDGDIASNAHGWQWTAGCGTDASPYYRIFNPITQGLRFDPEGDYVRRYIPELRHLSGAAAHEPWKSTDGHAHGYPQPMVDHAVEREVALARYEAIKVT